MNPFTLLPLIGFLLTVSAGVYTIKKGGKGFSKGLLAISIFSLSLAEFGNFMAFLSSSGQTALYWQGWSLGWLLLVSFFGTLFSLIFGRQNYRILLKKWGWYLTVLFLGILWFLSKLASASLVSEAEQLFNGYAFRLTIIGRYLFAFLLISLAIILVNLENTYRLINSAQKKRIKYLITGMCIFLSCYVILASLALLFSYIDTRFTLFSSLALSCGIILMISSVRRYGISDVRIHIGRQALYTSATLTIIGSYLLAIGIIIKLFTKIGLNLNSFLSFLAAFFVFLLFISIVFSKPLKEKINMFIDRTFYKDRYDYRREWMNFGEKTGLIFDMGELLESITSALSEIMHIKNVSIMLLDENRKRYSLAKIKGSGCSNETYFEKDSEVTDWLWRHGGPLEIKKVANKKIRTELEKLNVPVCVPLITKQKLIGILNIGEKITGRKFTNEDLELLKMVASQASIAISNVRLSESLIIARETEWLQKTSSFIIHDLKNFISVLSMIIQNAANNLNNPEFQKDFLDDISDTINKMNRLMTKLSTLPRKLELKLQQVDINGLIEEVISKLKIEQAGQVKLARHLNGLPSITADQGYIEKVILNLILNAIEAMSSGGKLTIGTRMAGAKGANGRYAEITVKDTGSGISPEFIQRQLFRPFQSSKQKGLGIGLFQCKSIVEAHYGSIEVESEVGKGTIFTVKLPITRLIPLTG